MSVNIPFPIPNHGYALNSKLRINLDYIVAQFNAFNTGTATWDNVSIGVANSATGSLTFYNANNANYLSFHAGTTASSITYTLPAAVPSATYNFLIGKADGVLKWSSNLSWPDSAITGNQLLYIDGAGVIKEVPVGSGNKVLVNSSPPSFFSLLGTTNQIIVTPNVGNYTLSTPQDINTSSNVIFNSVQSDGGTATNPGIRVIFSGASTNTGLFSSSGTSLSITVAGTLRGAFDNTGDLSMVTSLHAPTIRATTAFQLSTSTSHILTMQVTTGGAADYTINWPNTQGGASTILNNDGSGNLTWVSASASGTVNSGTSGQFTYYAASSNAVSGNADFTYSGHTVTLSAANSGASVGLQVLNTSNTASATAFLKIQTAGSTADDPYAVFDISGSTTWSLGADNSASDSFKISKNATLGTNDFLTISTAGAVTLAGALAMGTHKVTGLSNGSSSDDAAAFGQLKVIQVIFSNSTTNFNTTSSTFQTTNCAASITPSSASNKILVIVGGCAATRNASLSNCYVSLFRGSTNLGGGSDNAFMRVKGPSGNIAGSGSFSYVDSPASTSSLTYSVKIANDDNTTTIDYNVAGTTSIALLEIVA